MEVEDRIQKTAKVDGLRPIPLRKDTAKAEVKTHKRLHVVCNTHWDREHRHGLQETRCMLVEMLDRLLAIMHNDPRFKHFILDGQCVPLEDYLEVRPENEAKLRSLVEQGRLHIGPWYTLPDMNAVNGESLIRNLLTGDQVCRKFGGKMMFGYSIFSFGQIAQLPQIYRGFGIEDVIVYKRFSPNIFKQSEYLWTSPDGSCVLASRLGSLFRINFMMCFTIPVILGGDARKPGWETEFTGPTRLAHMVDSHFKNQYARELEPDIRVRKEMIAKALEDTMDSLKESAGQKAFMAFDGIDFSYPLKEVCEAIEYANELMGEEMEIVQSTPMAYFKELRKELKLDTLYNHCGEIRFGPIDALHSECMSANVELKIRNTQAENTMLYYAEPFSMLNKVCGGDYPTGLLERAWRYLFKVHAHDSIHGTGVPKIKRDALYRIEQAQELGDTLSRIAFESIVSKLDTSHCDNNDLLISIFNPSPHPTSEVVKLNIDLPEKEYVTNFHLETLDGKRVEMYPFREDTVNIPSVNGENRPKAVRCDRRMIDAYIEQIPAFGYKTLKIKRTVNTHKHISPFSQPVFPYNPIGIEPNMLDNGILQVTVEPNGTVTVRDKQLGHVYNGLNVFSDSGCAGDLWIYNPPADNRILTSIGAAADIGLTHNSNLSGTIRVEMTLNIPEKLSDDKKSRSPHTAPTHFCVDITLNRNSRRVDFCVKFNNNVKDHRLSVGFATGIKTDAVYSENPFEVRKRPVDAAVNHHGKIDDEVVLRQPMQRFVDISDGQRGVALMTRGLKEFQTWYRPDKTVHLELTLLRSVSQKFPIHQDVFVASEEDESAQCLGPHTFEYALYFHPQDYAKGQVIVNAQRYQAPPAAIQFGKGTGRGTLPLDDVSFVGVSCWNTVVNSVKKAVDGDDVIVRLTNPTGVEILEELRFYHKIKEAWLADMNEQKQEVLKPAGLHLLKVNLPPYRIVTLRVALE